APMPHCIDANIEVALGIGTGLPTPIIQWQVSQDEGLSWQNFGSPSTSGSLVIDQLPADLALRALVAADSEKITRPTCRYITNAIAFEYAPIENCPTTIIDTVLCAGQTIQVGNEIFHADGTFQVFLKDVTGADSLVQLNLTVNSPIQTFENIGLCPGDTYEGITYQTDTTISTIHSAVNGCDSTHAVNIVLFPAPNPQITGPASLCDGRPERLLTSGTFVQYEWSNGGDGPALQINAPGLYGLTVTDDMGCIGEASWEVLETRIKVGYQITPPSCASAADGILHIDQIAGGSGNYEVRLDGKVIRESTIAVPSGNFQLQITDSQGCSTTENISILPASPLALSVQDRYEIFSGQSIDLSFEANHQVATVQWTSLDSLSCPNCESPNVSPAFTTRYQVFVEDDRGCTAEAEITVVVRQEFAYFAPNVFSPNDDGINDYFSIFGGNEIQYIEDFKIFNRWGTLLFSQDQLTLGSEIWNGSYRGQALPNGVYVYQGEIVGQNGKRQPIMGEFMLLR
ncbi:MAG: gliding motility-associated C-terminal domain-containing protein, partial [Cyanothece sp. SIO1E1]|nr:gliding motility-associated C-terminal domain-containing protein [Cyanothece sp. SIO1E1]